MLFPLELYHDFGQFAFKDGRRAVESLAAIEDFMEEYGSDQANAVTLERQAGVVTAARTAKLVPNMQINLKPLIQDAQNSLGEALDFPVVSDFIIHDWQMKVETALYLIQFAIDLKTVKLKPEHAWVLLVLHQLSGAELQLEIPLPELQARVQQDKLKFSFSTDELDEVLKDLADLHCVSRQQDVIHFILNSVNCKMSESEFSEFENFQNGFWGFILNSVNSKILLILIQTIKG